MFLPYIWFANRGYADSHSDTPNLPVTVLLLLFHG